MECRSRNLPDVNKDLSGEVNAKYTGNYQLAFCGVQQDGTLPARESHEAAAAKGRANI